MKRRSRRFPILVTVLLLAFAGYTAFWFYARNTARDGFTRAVAAMQARGEAVEFESAEWSGYPIRLAVDIKGLRYAGRGVEFEADTFRAEVLPWNPNHALMRADGNVRLALREPQRVEWIEFRPVTAIAALRVTFDGALRSADLELREVRADATDPDGRELAFAAARLQFDVRAATDPGAAVGASSESYQLATSADALFISEGFAPTLGPRIDKLRVAAWAKNLPPFQGGVAGVADLSRQLQATNTVLEIARLDFDWGGVSVRGTGRMTLDPALRPEGTLDTRVTGLSKLVDALTSNGTLQANGTVPALPDAPGGTPIALAIKGGLITFGPFTIGEIGAVR